MTCIDQFVLGVPLGHRRPDFVPTGAHVACVRERASYWAGVGVRAKASWRATRSDSGEPYGSLASALYLSLDLKFSISVVVVCDKFLLVKLQEKMPPRRSLRRGGANPNAPVTQADLASIEQRYQDMLQAALAPFLAAQQTQAAPVQAQTVSLPAPVGAQPESVQLSTEAKHLRDFRKYMKCPEDQKVQCVVFFLEDRGTVWWETAERMLGGDVSKITWEQFKESFYA
ncbi:gag protease polyprotein [Cucumis melo var. makuwa]|uniref:Gag protease polyprotein n=1 Tax=Cucumis melo var. makuwa TaxID=1194695 RepID=A0A5A7UTI8_CUCMM|nr:gag protease polyprotein [Cucumis melo var. makuwa]TYK00801.1 gag protease polyprotein [Cucumis melo var. makuwa]